MTTFQDLAKKRRSVRQYVYEPIPKNVIEEILAAGIEAPSSCNTQPWHFYAVTSQEKIAAIAQSSVYGKFGKDCGLLLVCAVAENRANKQFGGDYDNRFPNQDMGACMQNMLLSATDHGLASCWLGILDEPTVRVQTDMNSNHTPVGILCIGKGNDGGKAKWKRLPLSEVTTWVE